MPKVLTVMKPHPITTIFGLNQAMLLDILLEMTWLKRQVCVEWRNGMGIVFDCGEMTVAG